MTRRPWSEIKEPHGSVPAQIHFYTGDDELLEIISVEPLVKSTGGDSAEIVVVFTKKTFSDPSKKVQS